MRLRECPGVDTNYSFCFVAVVAGSFHSKVGVFSSYPFLSVDRNPPSSLSHLFSEVPSSRQSCTTSNRLCRFDTCILTTRSSLEHRHGHQALFQNSGLRALILILLLGTRREQVLEWPHSITQIVRRQAYQKNDPYL